MNADEIRKKPLELVNKIAHASREDQVTSIISCACFEMLVEIAAQLSELNENIKLLATTEAKNQEPCTCFDGVPYKVGVKNHEKHLERQSGYEEEIETVTEEKRKLAELLAQPVSDPEKFVRCSDCGQEIERPSWLEKEKNTIICDGCIPF